MSSSPRRRSDALAPTARGRGRVRSGRRRRVRRCALPRPPCGREPVRSRRARERRRGNRRLSPALRRRDADRAGGARAPGGEPCTKLSSISRPERQRPTAIRSSSRPSPPAGSSADCGSCSSQPGESRTLSTGPDEVAVLPLSGGVVNGRGRRSDVRARRARSSVFARVTDWAYVPIERGADAHERGGLRARPRLRACNPTPRAGLRRGRGGPGRDTRRGNGDPAGDELPHTGRLRRRRQADLLRAPHPRRQLVVVSAAQARRHRGKPGGQRGDLLLPRGQDRRRRSTRPRATASTAPTRTTDRSTRPSPCGTGTCSSCPAATTGRARQHPGTRSTT